MSMLSEPLSVQEVRAHLGIRLDDRDGEIARLVPAAREQVEDLSGHLLTKRPYVQQGANWPCGRIEVHVQPVHAVLSLEHINGSGVVETLPCRLVPWSPPMVYPDGAAFWPAVSQGYRLTVEAGFAKPDIPVRLLQAMLLLIGHWFENHEAVVVGTIAAEVPMGVRDICHQFRTPGIS